MGSCPDWNIPTATGTSSTCHTTVGVAGHLDWPSQSRPKRPTPTAKTRMRTPAVSTASVGPLAAQQLDGVENDKTRHDQRLSETDERRDPPGGANCPIRGASISLSAHPMRHVQRWNKPHVQSVA